MNDDQSKFAMKFHHLKSSLARNRKQPAVERLSKDRDQQSPLQLVAAVVVVVPSLVLVAEALVVSLIPVCPSVVVASVVAGHEVFRVWLGGGSC